MRLKKGFYLILLVAIFAPGIRTANAQIKLGLGAGWGGNNGFTAQLNGQYFFSDRLALSMDYNHFFTPGKYSRWKWKFNEEVNLNLNYYLIKEGWIRPFLMAGHGFRYGSYTQAPAYDRVQRSYESYFNLGYGVDIKLSDKVSLFYTHYLSAGSRRTVTTSGHSGIRLRIK